MYGSHVRLGGDAAKHMATHVRAVLSSFIILRTGEIDGAALLQGALLPGVLQGPLQPVCHCHIVAFMLKIQPQNERGLDKFLEFKNSDQY
jgi:hypothetical protein